MGLEGASADFQHLPISAFPLWFHTTDVASQIAEYGGDMLSGLLWARRAGPAHHHLQFLESQLDELWINPHDDTSEEKDKF